MSKPEVIFFGNGPLAENTLKILKNHVKIIFHAHDKDDLEKVKKLKKEHPDAHGILASFGVILKPDVLELFEPEGILNIHPSELPKYRGPSPIETAILNGDMNFGVSVMKLVEKMDAGPIYYQTAAHFENVTTSKSVIYETLAEKATEWLIDNLEDLPTPWKQKEKRATYTKKLDTSMSRLDPINFTALELNNQVRAFADFPKSRIEIDGIDCIILEANPARAFNMFEEDILPPGDWFNDPNMMALTCADGNYLVVTKLQPAGKKPMSAQDFINGHGRDWQHEFTGFPDAEFGIGL